MSEDREKLVPLLSCEVLQLRVQEAQKCSKAEVASVCIYVHVTGDSACAFDSSKSCAAKGSESFWVGRKGRITAAQISKVMVLVAT